jgi:hypothetical protein
MSQFPVLQDDDRTLPPVHDNITEIGAEAINACREAIFNIESELGLTSSGTCGTLSNRLDVSFNLDGSIKPSIFTGLGLLYGPISNVNVAVDAGIIESKLKLDYSTSYLYGLLQGILSNMDQYANWIQSQGNKRLAQLEADLQRLRSDLDALTLAFHGHQKKDGSESTSTTITTAGGKVFLDSYAHHSSGLYADSSNFLAIPRNLKDVQAILEYIDLNATFQKSAGGSGLIVGSTGIIRKTRSSNYYGVSKLENLGDILVYLDVDGNPVKGYTYLSSNGQNDSITNGDDVVELKPSNTSFAVDQQFALVREGDVATITYLNYSGGSALSVRSYIKEHRYEYDDISGTRKLILRLDTKNVEQRMGSLTDDSQHVKVVISRPNYHLHRDGVFALAAVNNDVSIAPSLVLAPPTSAQVIGRDFDPNQIDQRHHNLYLVLYPTGKPANGFIQLPAVDVSGNAGATPGLYTLESVVAATNAAFRRPGFNFRFVAFSHDGEFGIKMLDSYSGAAFSIVNGALDTNGNFNQVNTEAFYPNNVIGLYSYAYPSIGGNPTSENDVEPGDPLGLGARGANAASPVWGLIPATNPSTVFNPTKLFFPQRKSTVGINGNDVERFKTDVAQTLTDPFGDNYWEATILSRNTISLPGGQILNKATYRLGTTSKMSTARLAPGTTITALPAYGYENISYQNNYGRFIVESVSSVLKSGSTTEYDTDIAVYDSVHGSLTGGSSLLSTGQPLKLYFDHGNVVSNAENAFDQAASSYSKLYSIKEVYTKQDGSTFVHERARHISGSSGDLTKQINGVNLYGFNESIQYRLMGISPKMQGYSRGGLKVITLNVSTLSAGGAFKAYLCKYSSGAGVNSVSHKGPEIVGRYGEITRIYDETFVDYIDVYVDPASSLTPITNSKLDIQVFDAISSNEEYILAGTYTYDNALKKILFVNDKRQFGNISERDLSSSALNYISAADKAVHMNGVIQGFDLYSTDAIGNDQETITSNRLRVKGGAALVSGKVCNLNDQNVVFRHIAVVPDPVNSPSVTTSATWALVVNQDADLEQMLITDTGALTTVRFTNPDTGVSTNYTMESYRFQDVVENKRVTPLYLVVRDKNAYVALSTTDVRRYASNIESSFDVVVSDKSYDGFRTLSSALTWIKSISSENTKLVIKGVAGLVSKPVDLSVLNGLVIEGRGSATLNCSTLTFGDNMSVTGLTVNASSIVIPDNKSVKLERCTVNLSSMTIGAQADIAKRIFVQDCKVAFANLPQITTQAGRTLVSCPDASGLVFSHNVITVDDVQTNVYQGTNTLFNFYGGSDIDLSYNEVSGDYISFLTLRNYFSAIGATAVNRLRVHKNYLQYSTSPVRQYTGTPTKIYALSEDVASDPSLNTSYEYNEPWKNDLLGGFINVVLSASAGIQSSIDGLDISENKIVYAPDTLGGMDTRYRYPFISLRLMHSKLLVSGVKIDENRFFHMGIDRTSISYLRNNDTRAAVLISQYTDNGTNPLSADDSANAASQKQYSLIQGSISNNYCAQDQGVVVSHYSNYYYSKRFNDIGFFGHEMNGAGATAIDTVKNALLAPSNLVIANNKCGYIGTCLAGVDSVLDNSIQRLSDLDTLDIRGNTTKLIATLTAEGRFVYPVLPNSDQTVSGVMAMDTIPQNSCHNTLWMTPPTTKISQNRVSWIHLSTCGYLEEKRVARSGQISISRNDMVADDYSILPTLTMVDFVGIDPTDSVNTRPWASPTDIRFLATTGVLDQNMGYVYGSPLTYAIAILGRNSYNVQATISGNTTSEGYKLSNPLSGTATVVVQGYTTTAGGGYVYCQTSNKIVGNYFQGCLGQAQTMRQGLIAVGGKVNNALQNTVCKLPRSYVHDGSSYGNLVGANYNVWGYVSYEFFNGELTTGPMTSLRLRATDTAAQIVKITADTHVNGVTGVATVFPTASRGTIKGNVFDSFSAHPDWISDSTTFSAACIPAQFLVDDNKNQTNYLILGWTDGTVSYGGEGKPLTNTTFSQGASFAWDNYTSGNLDPQNYTYARPTSLNRFDNVLVNTPIIDAPVNTSENSDLSNFLSVNLDIPSLPDGSKSTPTPNFARYFSLAKHLPNRTKIRNIRYVAHGGDGNLIAKTTLRISQTSYQLAFATSDTVQVSGVPTVYSSVVVEGSYENIAFYAKRDNAQIYPSAVNQVFYDTQTVNQAGITGSVNSYTAAGVMPTVEKASTKYGKNQMCSDVVVAFDFNSWFSGTSATNQKFFVSPLIVEYIL